MTSVAETLIELITREDTAALASTLASGVAVDARDGNGWTPAFHAAVGGRVDALVILLDAGAVPDACELARPEIRLSTEPAAADARNTLLHVAAAFGQLGVVARLLGRGAAVDMRDGDGATPLMFAVAAVGGGFALEASRIAYRAGQGRAGALAVVQALLAAGADPNTTSADGRGVADYLQPGAPDASAAFDALCAAGWTAHVAPIERTILATVLPPANGAPPEEVLHHLALLRRLLARGVPAARMIVDAIHFPEALAILLAAGPASSDVLDRSLDWMIERRSFDPNVDALRMIVAAGATQAALDRALWKTAEAAYDTRSVPLHPAIFDVFDLLVDAGARADVSMTVTARDVSAAAVGVAALHYLSSFATHAVRGATKTLIKNATAAAVRADTLFARCAAASRQLDVVDERGRTPLHWACGAIALERVHALVQLGADPRRRSSDGRDALAHGRPDLRATLEGPVDPAISAVARRVRDGDRSALAELSDALGLAPSPPARRVKKS